MKEQIIWKLVLNVHLRRRALKLAVKPATKQAIKPNESNEGRKDGGWLPESGARDWTLEMDVGDVFRRR